MLIDNHVAKQFAELFLELAKETAKLAHKYIGQHENIDGYYKYPKKSITFSRDEPAYEKLYEKVPFLTYDIPKYEMADFPADAILYSAIFNGYANDCIDCSILEEFDILVNFVCKQSHLKEIISEKEDNLKTVIKLINNDIVERYLYKTNATDMIPKDLDEKMRPFVAERLLSFLKKELNINILVPICLATFEEDTIKLTETIEIVRISEEIQKSRQQACTYEVSSEDWVAACATHMIVFHQYHFSNTKDRYSINRATQNYNSYPLKEIDKVIAAIRIVTGYSIGYEQILSFPIGWIDGFCADLIPLYGAKAHFVNPKEIEKYWMVLPVSKVNKKQSKLIQKVYYNIVNYRESVNNGNILFALNRFNRCMLRNEPDDMAIDATIGLEALLVGRKRDKIKDTLSRRIPIVFHYIRDDLYTVSNSKVIMKAIYNYRSGIVHGDKLKNKEKYLNIKGKKLDVAIVAVDFLRYTLLLMTKHCEFLDVKKIDEYINKGRINRHKIK